MSLLLWQLNSLRILGLRWKKKSIFLKKIQWNAMKALATNQQIWLTRQASQTNIYDKEINILFLHSSKRKMIREEGDDVECGICGMRSRAQTFKKEGKKIGMQLEWTVCTWLLLKAARNHCSSSRQLSLSLSLFIHR